MPFTKKEHEQIETAKTFPADVLLHAVTHQAENNILSEAHCKRLEAAYHKAGKIARRRREKASSHVAARFAGYGTE